MIMKKLMAVLAAAALISVSAMLASCTDNTDDNKVSGTNSQAVTTEDTKDTGSDAGTTDAADTSADDTSADDTSAADTSDTDDQSSADTSAAA